jgi:hypothetical protein
MKFASYSSQHDPSIHNREELTNLFLHFGEDCNSFVSCFIYFVIDFVIGRTVCLTMVTNPSNVNQVTCTLSRSCGHGHPPNGAATEIRVSVGEMTSQVTS